MKDASSGVRRKLRAIVELRYPARPEIFDTKGKLLAVVHPVIEDQFPHWKADVGSITFLDDLTTPTREFMISLRRTAFILEDPGSVQEFVDKGEKCLGLVFDHLGGGVGSLTRLGVRLIEVCTPERPASFEEMVATVCDSLLTLPSDLGLRTTDAMFNVVHDRGMYVVGPVKKGEEWVKQMFKNADTNMPDVGIGLDIDSYAEGVAVKTKHDLQAAFLSVYELTKAVEESLLRHQGMIDA